jgi:hypothetical protein
MDMMGKFLTRSNRSKTRRKTRRRWRWCVGFHLFLSAVQFSVCFNVQNCCCGCCCWNSSRVCSSSQHKSMQICPLSVRVHRLSFWTSKTKNKKTAHHWIIFNRNFFAFLINFSITSRCCCSSSPHMETLTKQFLLGQWNSQSKIYKTPLSLN